MPVRGLKFITEFLVPNLNNEKFGSRLKWIDPKRRVFQIQWSHKSASDWTSDAAEVFIEWDKLKGHYKPEDKEYYTRSKQRFRAILYKMMRGKHIKEICSTDRNTKLYCIDCEKYGPGVVYPDASSERQNLNSFIPEDRYHPERIYDFESVSSEIYVAENQYDSINGDHRYINEEPAQTDLRVMALCDSPSNNNVSSHWNGHSDYSKTVSEDTNKSTSFGTIENENCDLLCNSQCTNIELFVVPEMDHLEENLLPPRLEILTPPQMDTPLPDITFEWEEQDMKDIMKLEDILKENPY